MIIFIVGILLLIYGIISKKRYSVYIAMCFVLLIMGFQDGVQGDFMSYKESFIYGLENNYTLKDTEFSYIFSVNAFQFTSFGVYVFVLSLLQCLIIAYALRRYVSKKYQNFGWLVFFFTTGCMLIQMKAMRQGYAIETVLLSFVLLDRRKFVSSLMTLLIGWGFHNSAIIFLPIYLVLFINKLGFFAKVQLAKIIHARIFPLIVGAGVFVFYFLKKVIIDSYLLPYLMTLNFAYGGYAESLEITPVSWWIICFYALFAYCTAAYMSFEKDSTKQIIAFGNLVAIFGAIMVWGIGNLQRIFHYYTIFGVLTYPLVTEFIARKYGKAISAMFVFLYLVFAFKFSSEWLFTSASDMFGSYKFSFF